MNKRLLRRRLMAFTILIMGSACAHAAPGGRITALYIGPITLNNGNGPRTVGIPDSIAYTYSGSRAVYDLATTYALDTVSYTSAITAYERFTYTSADSLLTDVNQSVSNGVAINTTRVSRLYDAAGNDTLILNESWDANASAWVGSFRTIYTFNASRQMTGTLQQTWNASAGAWTNFNRFAYQYDAAGRDSMKVQQKWMSATGTWKNVTSNRTLYTSFGKVAFLYSQRWSDTTTVWKDSTSMANHYNSSNEIQSTVIDAVFYGGRALWADSLATLTHNAAGSPLVQIFYQKSFPVASNLYIPLMRYTSSYNAANQRLSNQTELVDNAYVAYNSLTGFYQYNSAGQATLQEPVSTTATNALLDKEHYRSYYEAITSVAPFTHPASSEIALYPSPATSVVTLSLCNDWKGAITGLLTDMSGGLRMRWSEAARPGYTRCISVSALPPGLYFLRVDNGIQTGGKMLVVQH